MHVGQKRKKKMKNFLMNRKSLVFFRTMILTLVILLSIVGSATAQQNPAASVRKVSAAPSEAPGPIDPAEMEAFLDSLFAQQMEEHNVAGAAISVVKDGKLFFAKGYGYA